MDQSHRGERRKSLKFCQTVGTIVDAGIFMHALKRSEYPDLVLLYRAAQRGNVVLSREWLFGLWFGIVNREACIQRRRTFVKGCGAVPQVRALFCGYDNRSSNGAPGVRFFV